MFRVDAVPNPGELFAVERPRARRRKRVRFTRPQYEALRRETNVFSDAFAMLPDIDSRIDGRMMAGTLVTGNFFQVLGVNAALGRTLVPGDDERFARPAGDGAQPPRLVATLRERSGASIGRSLLVNGFSYEIVGVMPEGFRGLERQPRPTTGRRSRCSASSASIHAGREDAVGIDVIGRLKPGLSRQTALAGLAVWDSGRTGGGAVDRRRASITLEPRQGTIAAAGGSAAGVHAALLCLRTDPDDRLRKRRQPPAGTRRLAPA